jgi:hypothetical protein
MSRNVIHQVNEISEKIELHAGNKIREMVMEGSEQITASSKPEKVAKWVQGMVERLDNLVDEATRTQIMMNCGYNCAQVNNSPIERAQARRKKYKSVDEFLEAEQRNPPTGTRLIRDGDVLYQFYTPQKFTHPMRCYCSLGRGLPDGETTSITYCLCSKGFVQKYWESVLERPVDIELLESCLAGAKECKFVIVL